MKTNRKATIQFWEYVREYLLVYLPKNRRLSPRTIDCYRQSIAMYCTFLKERCAVRFSQLSFDHVTRDSVLKYLHWLGERKDCGASTCNLRVSSLKSFLKYCAETDVRLYAIYQRVRTVPLVKAPKKGVGYMSETALKELLRQPDGRTAKGMRNKMLLILLYDTGARVQELVDMKVGDLHLHTRVPFIVVTGKGSKTRSIPLMEKTVAHLKDYLRRFHADSVNGADKPLFYSIRDGLPHALSTDAISVMVKGYAEIARTKCPEVPQRVYPHLIRHTRAMHLYRSGIPLSYLADFLGHASVDTTQVYASASVDMLHEALRQVDPVMGEEHLSWKVEENLRKLCGLQP